MNLDSFQEDLPVVMEGSFSTEESFKHSTAQYDGWY
jgi:hypothetical protein